MGNMVTMWRCRWCKDYRRSAPGTMLNLGHCITVNHGHYYDVVSLPVEMFDRPDGSYPPDVSNGYRVIDTAAVVEDVQAIHAYLNKVNQNTLEREEASGVWKTFKHAVYSVLGAITGFFVSLLSWVMNRGS